MKRVNAVNKRLNEFSLDKMNNFISLKRLLAVFLKVRQNIDKETARVVYPPLLEHPQLIDEWMCGAWALLRH